MKSRAQHTICYHLYQVSQNRNLGKFSIFQSVGGAVMAKKQVIMCHWTNQTKHVSKIDFPFCLNNSSIEQYYSKSPPRHPLQEMKLPIKTWFVGGKRNCLCNSCGKLGAFLGTSILSEVPELQELHLRVQTTAPVQHLDAAATAWSNPVCCFRLSISSFHLCPS